MTVLELQEVTKVFSGRKGAQVRALDRVSFCIEEGESVGLIGPVGKEYRRQCGMPLYRRDVRTYFAERLRYYRG